MDEFSQEFHRDIEKYWRNKFADEIDSHLINDLENDAATEWFNKGMKHASLIIRFTKDN